MVVKFAFGSGEGDMRYVAGFDVFSPFAFVRSSEDYFFVSPLEFGKFKGRNVFLSSDPLRDSVAFLRRRRVKNLEVPSWLSFRVVSFLERAGFKLSSSEPFLPERVVKSSFELRQIKRVGLATKALFEVSRDLIKRSVVKKGLLFSGTPLSSERVKRVLKSFAVDVGVELPELIVSCCSHSAVPHHSGSGLLRAHKPVIFDIFPRGNYWFDVTRTFVKGSSVYNSLFDAVLSAKSFAESLVKPGVSGSFVHKEVVDFFVKRGFFTSGSKGFVHALGHGVGLDLHEFPRLSSKGSVLVDNSVFTLEPGLYYSVGVRFEDTYFLKGSLKRFVKIPLDYEV